jgi:hypothetical protein
MQIPEFVGLPTVCGCAERVRLARRPGHIMHCKRAGRQISYRHDLVRDELVKLAKVCVGPVGVVQIEQPFERRGNLMPCIMDIIVTTAEGIQYYVDVAVVDPSAKSYVFGSPSDDYIAQETGSAHVRGSAAERKTVLKNTLAGKCLSPSQMAGFSAFALETTGLIGESGQGFLKCMQQTLALRVGELAPEQFKKALGNFEWALNTILARGTARIRMSAQAVVRQGVLEGAVEWGAGEMLAMEGGETPGLGIGVDDDEVFVELLVNVGAGVADAAGDFEVQAQADPEAQQYAEGDGGGGVADADADAADAFEVQAQADPEAQQYAEGDGGRGDNIYFIIPRGVDEVEGGPLPLRR